MNFMRMQQIADAPRRRHDTVAPQSLNRINLTSLVLTTWGNQLINQGEGVFRGGTENGLT